MGRASSLLWGILYQSLGKVVRWHAYFEKVFQNGHYFLFSVVIIDFQISRNMKLGIFNIYEKETLIYKRLQSIDLDHCSTKCWSQPISRLQNQFPSS